MPLQESRSDSFAETGGEEQILQGAKMSELHTPQTLKAYHYVKFKRFIKKHSAGASEPAGYL